MLRRMLALGLLMAPPLLGCATLDARRQGDALIAEGRYEEAIALYQAALAERSSSRLLEALEEARQLESSRLTTQAEADLAAGDAVGAFNTLVAALEIDGGNLTALDLLDRARDAVLSEAQRWERRAQPQRALELYGLALSEYKRHEEARAGYERALRALAEARYRDGLALAKDRPVQAMVAFLAADAWIPGFEDAAAQAAAQRDRLRAEARIPMLVELRAARGAGLRPADWRVALEEEAQATGWALDVISRPPRGGLPQGALSMRAEVEALKVRGHQGQREVSRTAEEVDDRRPNPAYAQLEAAARQAEDAAQAARADVDAAEASWQHARERLSESPGSGRAMEAESAARAAHQAARAALTEALSQRDAAAAALAEERPFLGEVRVTTATFIAQEGWIEGQLTVTGRCHALGDAPVDLPISLSLAPRFEDLGHDAVPALGLPPDPLELPSEDALRAQLGDAARDAVLGGARACWRAHVDDRWATAHRLVDQGWKDAAAQALMEAWLTEPAQGKEEVMTFLTEALGAPVDGLEALFKDLP